MELERTAKELAVDIAVLLVFSIGFPLTDTFSDINLMANFFMYEHTRWGSGILTILSFQTTCTMILWALIEKGPKKRFTWILVLLQLWPQFRAAMVIIAIFRRKSNAEKQKKAFQRVITPLEPYTESLPQV